MKKVSVGVFAILTAFVVVKSGRADIASQGYVDSQIYHLASKEYVDANFQKLNKKVTPANYTKLVDTDKISKDQLYTSLEYVDSQDALFVKKTDATVDAVGGTAGTFISGVSQLNGMLGAKAGAFVSDISNNSSSVVAPQTAAVVAFVNQKISDIGGDIGNAYQLKSEKLKSTDSDDRITEDNKDDLYPSVAKTEDIVKNAILDLNTGPIGETGSFIATVHQQEGELGARVVPFETVIDDSTKDSVVAPQTKAVKAYVDTQDALFVKKTDATVEEVGGTAGTFISGVSQSNGVLGAKAGTFVSNIDADSTSVVAPQTAAVVNYAEALSNKLTAAEYKGNEAPADKDRLYPSVSLTEFIAQEAAKAAIKQLQAIVNVPAKCAQAEKYCVLTTNGTDFVWEVIERSTSEDFPEPSVSTDANAERMKVYPITNQ